MFNRYWNGKVSKFWKYDENLLFLQENCCIKILFSNHYFSPLNTFRRKGKDPYPLSDPYLWLTDPDADPGGSKTNGSYGSETLSARKWLDTLSAYTVSIFWCSLFQELCRSSSSGREGSSTAQEGRPGPNIMVFLCKCLWEVNIDEIGKLWDTILVLVPKIFDSAIP